MQLETLTKALADQTRLRVVNLLMGQGELCVCDLTEVLEMSQPKISRHLAILRDSGLLQTRKSGLWVFYSFNPDLPQWAKALLNNLHNGSLTESLYQSDTERFNIAKQLENLKCC